VFVNINSKLGLASEAHWQGWILSCLPLPSMPPTMILMSIAQWTMLNALIMLIVEFLGYADKAPI
jgi:hypothetical protein